MLPSQSIKHHSSPKRRAAVGAAAFCALAAVAVTFVTPPSAFAQNDQYQPGYQPNNQSGNNPNYQQGNQPGYQPNYQSGNGQDNYGSYGQANRSSRIARGTNVKVKLLQDISSDTAQVGDTVRAEVASDDNSGLPAGTVLDGTVTAVHPATPKSAGSISFDLGQSSNNGGSYYNNQNSGSRPHGYLFGQFSGTSPRGSSHYTAPAAAAGGILGFIRKRKLGDLIEGAGVGAVAGVAADQATKRSASDINLKKGSEVTVTVNRPLSLRTTIVPDNY